MEEVHRIFVGGLFESVTKDELSNRFQTFGDVKDVTIVHKKDGEGNTSKTFGYINLFTTTQKLNRCFGVYGGTKWKGCELKVQLAKEDFMARLQKERNEPEVVTKKKNKRSCGPSKTYTDILETTSTMKKIVPGTPVEGERNWVIGKYGRPLPILHIPKVGGRKLMKVDPSKFCHCLKRIPDGGESGAHVSTLTWSYDKDEINLRKKKKKSKGECTGEEVASIIKPSISNDVEDEEIMATNGDEEKHEGKRKKKQIKKETLVDDSDLVKCVPDDDMGKRKKRKHKDGVVGKDNCSEEPAETVDSVCCENSAKKKRKQKEKKKEDIGEQSNFTKPDDLKNKNTKLSATIHSEDVCIPEILFEGMQDDEPVDNGNHGNILSRSIVEQLNSTKSPPCSTPSCGDEKDVHIVENGNSELDENLFDFDFKDIGGKNKSFLDKMINSFELRESFNEGNESEEDSSSESSIDYQRTKGHESNESEEDSSESSIDYQTTKGHESESSVDYQTTKLHNVGSNDENIEQINAKNINQNNKKINKSKNVEKVDTVKQIEKSKNLELIDSDQRIKKSKISNSNKEEKHALSEEQRRRSLEVRNTQINENKGLVNKALKDVDKLTSSANRIVFSESDGEEESAVVLIREAGGKSFSSDEVEGKTRDKTKTLFDEDDEETTDEEDEIIVKPQFQGKEGEKLFKMQQKFGVDERFKMDERFAEEEKMAEEEKEVNISGDEEGEDDGGLQKERDMNISVLEQVLGKSITMENKESDYTYERYDPDNIEHKKFEIKVKPTVPSADDNEMDVAKVKKKQPVPKAPEVSKDTFYSVNESIKDLFGKGESASFGFLLNEEVDTSSQHDVQNGEMEECDNVQSDEMESENQCDEGEQMEIDAEEKMKVPSWKNEEKMKVPSWKNEEKMKVPSWKNEEKMKVPSWKNEEKMKVPSWKKGLEDILRPEESWEENQVVTNGNKVEDDKGMCTYLYIPEDDRRLDIGKSFIRTEELEDITDQWKSMRRNLTEDYKKKHKDAVRRVRKMRERRFNKH